MTKLITSENNYRAFKALIASKYSGKAVSAQTVDPAKANTHFGKIPSLEVSGSSALFDSSAIAYYLSNAQLRGGDNELSQAQVLQWKATLESAKAEAKTSLKLLNDYLLTRTYLVGEQITLADIAVAVSLLPLYQYVLEPSVRSAFGNLNRWFTTLVNQKEFAAVLGKVELCESVKQLQAGAGQAQAGQQGKKENKKKEAKKQAAEQPKKAEPKKKEVEEQDDGGDEINLAPKPKDPFEKLPEGQRFYSNNSEDKSVPYFWEKFDPEAYSIWYCEYKYPQELAQVFMSCNLISGMFQRLDRMRKNAFSSMILFGEDNNSTISGVWVWRGQELAFPLADDWTVDYQSYEWKKLNPTDEKTKTLVKEYFSWDGAFDGKKFNQGKIFK
ncbi:Translation elongation factor [Tyrophagus putrescentiae]|nr:Translation elongation factor [Tyrophagus putrescentiae]